VKSFPETLYKIAIAPYDAKCPVYPPFSCFMKEFKKQRMLAFANKGFYHPIFLDFSVLFLLMDGLVDISISIDCKSVPGVKASDT